MLLTVGQADLVKCRQRWVDCGKFDADYPARQARITAKHLLAEIFRARKLPGRLTISHTAIGQCRVRQRAVWHACRYFPQHAERVDLGLGDLYVVRSGIVRLRCRREEYEKECEALTHGQCAMPTS